MSKYIIFKAESAPSQKWEEMQLAHTGAFTFILAEHYDSSHSPLPKPGYRLREYHRQEQLVDKRFPAASTHSRIGDWQVTRVEKYTPELPTSDLETIVICYCKYDPVETPLEPLPEIQVEYAMSKAI